jgi:uncharacterized membrane protein
MTLILLILLLGLFVAHLNLRDRVSDLEMKSSNTSLLQDYPKIDDKVNQENISSRLGSSEHLVTPINVVQVSQNISPVSQTETELKYTPQAVGVSVAKEPAEFFLVRWLKENTLIKIGSLIFFLGAVWLVSYAFISDWLSPMVLILLGLLLAIMSYVTGYLRMSVSKSQYVILTALGTGIVSATIFTAQIISIFFTPLLSLLLLILSLFYTMYVAWQTNASKLALATGVAGLLVPTLVGADAESLWLLLYLLVLTIGLLFVGFRMELRTITLLLVSGITLYEVGLFESTNPNLLWFFIVVFSLLFFSSVTMSFIKTKTTETLDVVSLAIVSLAFVMFASEIAISAGLTTFLATIITAGVGYFFMVRNYPATITAVYVAFTSFFLLISTGFIFNGYTEVLAFIIEVTAVFFIATYLGLPGRVIRLIALSYLLPLSLSLSSFGTSAWSVGIWHPDALVLSTVSLSLIGSAIWLVQNRKLSVYGWSHSLSAVFGLTGLLYLLAVIGQFTPAVFSHDGTDTVMMYVLWIAIIISLLLYVIRLRLANNVPIFLSFTLVLPVLASFTSINSSLWSTGVMHIHGFGVGTVSFFLVLTTLLFTQLFCVEYNQTIRRVLGLMIVLTLGYIFIALGSIYSEMLSYQLANVAKYISFSLMLYGLISLFVLLRVNINWLSKALLVLVLPLLMSLNSFAFNGWQKGDISDALGLFVIITLMILIGLGLRHRYHSENFEEMKKVLSWSNVLFVTAGIYSVAYLWSVSHTLLVGEKAVTLALFIYTLVGLFLYRYGHSVKKVELRHAGQVLLAFVVLRLLLIDVWEMDLLWRIVTFLGIGILFIGTAILEKQKKIDG